MGEFIVPDDLIFQEYLHISWFYVEQYVVYTVFSRAMLDVTHSTLGSVYMNEVSFWIFDFEFHALNMKLKELWYKTWFIENFLYHI